MSAQETFPVEASYVEPAQKPRHLQVVPPLEAGTTNPETNLAHRAECFNEWLTTIRMSAAMPKVVYTD